MKRGAPVFISNHKLLWRKRVLMAILTVFGVLLFLFLPGCTVDNTDAITGSATVNPPNNSQASLQKGKGNTYPIAVSKRIKYKKNIQGYNKGVISVPGGSKFTVERGALIPPPGTPQGVDITINMIMDYDLLANELRFEFGPEGCQFDPPAELRLKWNPLDSETATLYYIDDEGTYHQKTPDVVNYEDRWMKIYIDHFSRYALGAD